jgi:hypothetical protein
MSSIASRVVAVPGDGGVAEADRLVRATARSANDAARRGAECLQKPRRWKAM